MISEHDFWMGRDLLYPGECTKEVRANAAETVKRVNKILAHAEKDGIICTQVSSGWRPRSVNSSVSNAAKTSNHITGKAVDLADPDRKLAQWIINNKHTLSLCFLWAEDPRWTKNWLHLQIVPPLSGKLIYIPSLKPPTAPKLIGQTDLPLTRVV